MLGEVIRDVDTARSPEDEEMVLFDAVFDPIEPHVHGAATFLFNGIVGNAIGTCIVGLDGCSRLRVAHGSKDGAKHFGIFAVVKESTQFGFGGGGHDVLHDYTVNMDGAIEGSGSDNSCRGVDGLAEEKVTAHPRSSAVY